MKSPKHLIKRVCTICGEKCIGRRCRECFEKKGKGRTYGRYVNKGVEDDTSRNV